tara:strand:+ start:523 stop:2202 length:1680 start_codon:yes stop_codon:yes gene_type:complete
MQEDPIYIFGHKNPDADSVCSAIAYEALKHLLGQTHYVAARCGNSNARIDTILKQFGLPLPVFFGDVTPRLKDLMRTEMYTVSPNSTYAEALELIDEHDVRVLPAVDENGKLEGAISFFQLAETIIPKPTAPGEMRRVESSISAIIRALNATVLNATDPDRLQELYVRVGAMDVRSFAKYHHDQGVPAENSIVIVGDRWDVQERCIQLGIRLLVITGNVQIEDELLERARRKGVSLIVSPYDSASTSWIIRTATYLNHLVDPDVLCFSPDEKVNSIKGRIANSSQPLYMVVDDEKRLLGVFSKSDILRPSTTRIALVDHNELGQAVDGANDVQITEIIDHHRLGNVPTDKPILFVNRPVGSTCSIIADLFRIRGLVPSASIAGIMMSGIISDTLLLNSPTTTPLEGELLKWLEPIAGISSEDLADLIFSSGSLIVSSPPDEVVRSDCKVYQDGSIQYSVAQIEELGFKNFWNHFDKLEAAVESYRESEGHLFSLLFVTDINTQNSLLVVVGSAVLKNAINYPPMHGYGHVFDLKGIVSRKKQLIPYLSNLLKNTGLAGD